MCSTVQWPIFLWFIAKFCCNNQLYLKEGQQRIIACSRLEYQNNASVEKWTLLLGEGQYWYNGRTGYILLSCTFKNPAYGRQSISRPMRTVAPIQKSPASKAKFAFFIFFFSPSDFSPFMSNSFQVWEHFFLFLSHKDSENLKSLDIGLREMGAKRRLNGVKKMKKSF